MADGRSSADPASPVALPPSKWQFPPPERADDHGLVGLGADLEPATVIDAYRRGMFPMPADEEGLIAWWSPEPRAILELDRLHVSRSLRRACRGHRVTVDQAFDDVIAGCADPGRPLGWISPAIVDAYTELHRLGWVHSFEAWADGELVGGMYGVQIGGFFAGESMFHRRRDGSKVALVGAVAAMGRVGIELFDVQWPTDHLTTLGVGTVTRSDYLSRLVGAIDRAAPSLATLADGQSVLPTP